MKLIVRFILITLLAVFPINTSFAGASDWTTKAKNLQESYVKMTNEKYLPCFTLSAPSIPEFTENDEVNKQPINKRSFPKRDTTSKNDFSRLIIWCSSFNVSLSKGSNIAATKKPNIAKIKKKPRQLIRVASCPPMNGATTAAEPIIAAVLP